ncbi:MAG: hypothetical protein NTX49_05665 [Chlamydiae bacterium]|nr:hypothetical protein [Chlamydiota bacterium]
MKEIERSLFEGLGFPIFLKNIPVIEIHGEEILDIDFNQLQKTVLLSLCYKPLPLSGSQIKYIRKYFEMTRSEFGEKFGYSEAAVIKWEKSSGNFAKMDLTTDECIRLFIFRKMDGRSDAFKEFYDELDIRRIVKNQKELADKMLSIDLRKVALGE